MENFTGVSDKPREMIVNSNEFEKDMFKMDAYSIGLCSFIESCPTPMTIAIQGDWGSGKTSMINYISHYFNKTINKSSKIKSISINTWQFSQMNSDDKLALPFFATILNAINNKNIFDSVTIKGIAKVATNAASKVIGVDLNDIFKNKIDEIENVRQLKDNFAEEVRKSLKKSDDDRLLILVDDLDRLSPNVAVELLETIKLFLDIENCVFVLAIDYDVVVQGVKSKFGKDVTLEKCRSFFDKIVQLPFRMPVERYEFDDLIDNYLENSFGGYTKYVGSFAREAIGTNPRTFKRCINSFKLLEIIFKRLNEDRNVKTEDNAILFCIICIQTQFPLIYRYLYDNALETSFSIDESDNMIKEIQSYSEEELSQKQIQSILKVFKSLEKILMDICQVKDEAYDKLYEIIDMAAITSSGEANFDKSTFTKTTVFAKIGDKPILPYRSLAVAFAETLDLLLKESKYINTVIKKFSHFLTVDPDFREKQFAKTKQLGITCNINEEERNIYLGVKSGTDVKIREIEQLCEYLNIKHGYIKWLDINKDILFES